jgi:hypothetical protein
VEGLVTHLVRLAVGWLLVSSGVVLLLNMARSAKSRRRTGATVKALSL